MTPATTFYQKGDAHGMKDLRRQLAQNFYDVRMQLRRTWSFFYYPAKLEVHLTGKCSQSQ